MAFPYFMVMMMMTVRWYLDGKMVFLLPNANDYDNYNTKVFQEATNRLECA